MLHELTQREQDVTQLAVKGFTNKEIADFLGITSNGVKHHLKNIYAKLKVSGKTELANLIGNNFPLPAHETFSDSYTGLWASCFSCIRPDGREGLQYEILQVWHSGTDYIGRNILVFSDDFDFHYDFNFQVHDHYILGKWVDSNTFSVGVLQLSISKLKLAMTGAYLSSAVHLSGAGEEKLFKGKWKMVKLNLKEDELNQTLKQNNPDTIERMRTAVVQNFIRAHESDSALSIPKDVMTLLNYENKT